jgi:hypothetical protein
MSVGVQLDDDVFADLQSRARPLVDDVNSVLRRLLKAGRPNEVAPVREIVLSRGERLPIGLKLRATFQGQVFHAEVTEGGISFDGTDYPSPSAAARAVKRSVGVTERGSHTNGWDFWQYLDPERGAYFRLWEFRRRQSVPTARPPLTFVGAASSGRHDTSVLAGEPVPPLSWR